MTPVEERAVRNAVTDIEQGYTLVALSLLRSLLPPTVTTGVPPMDPIRRHRTDTACAGSAIDTDGTCHTCDRKVM